MEIRNLKVAYADASDYWEGPYTGQEAMRKILNEFQISDTYILEIEYKKIYRSFNTYRNCLHMVLCDYPNMMYRKVFGKPYIFKCGMTSKKLE